VPAAAWVVKNQYLTNYTLTTNSIKLSNAVTRQDVAYMLNEIDSTFGNGFTNAFQNIQVSFTDISDSDFPSAIEALAGKGVMAGITQADQTIKFEPKSSVNRGQAVQMFSTLLGRKDDSYNKNAPGFKDLNDEENAGDSVALAYKKIIMNAAFPT
jgi:hypothetical protein